MQPLLKVGSRDARLKSRGCLSCIRMKVKCDEAKPQCLRCRKSRRTCPGYRDPAALVFKVETGAPSPSKSTSQAFSLHPDDASVPVPMPTDWLQCAISYYFRNYVLARVTGCPGYYDFLPRLYGSCPEDGHLRHSVEAVALASFAQFKKMTAVYFRKSLQAYGQALTQLGLVLQSSSEAYSQAAAASVSMLWIYDMIMGEAEPGVASPHRQGLLEIMRARLTLNADGEKIIDRSMLATVHLQNINPSTYSSSVTPAMTPSAPFPPGVSLLEELLPRVTKLSVTHDTLATRIPNRQEAIETLEQLQQLMKDFAAWEASLPQEWMYMTYRNPNATQRNSFPSEVIVFPTLVIAGMQTAKWLAQLSVLRSMIIISLAAPRFGIQCPPVLDTRHQILSVVGSLCSSVPYLLGHVKENGSAKQDVHTPAIGAFFATRSLYVLSKIPHLPTAQLDWVMDRLDEIGQERGIRRALMLRQSIAERRAQVI